MSNDQWYWYAKINRAIADGKNGKVIRELIDDMSEELNMNDVAEVMNELGYYKLDSLHEN